MADLPGVPGEGRGVRSDSRSGAQRSDGEAAGNSGEVSSEMGLGGPVNERDQHSFSMPDGVI
eukprot:1587205-Pyramimonas_sp.AAC.1